MRLHRRRSRPLRTCVFINETKKKANAEGGGVEFVRKKQTLEGRSNETEDFDHRNENKSLR